jgi:hypothetical protein
VSLLAIVHAPYGLLTSGTCWNDRYVCVMSTMGFCPYKKDLDVWVKDCNTHSEYVLVYVDNIMIIGNETRPFLDALIKEHCLKLKEVGKPTYHLGETGGFVAWVA